MQRAAGRPKSRMLLEGGLNVAGGMETLVNTVCHAVTWFSTRNASIDEVKSAVPSLTASERRLGWERESI